MKLRFLLSVMAWVVLAGLALQLFFLGRTALMVVVDPQSTAFQRSEAWRTAWDGRADGQAWRWRQRWLDQPDLGKAIQRAVIASEDGGFYSHGGVDWSAIESAWQRNTRRQEQAEKRAEKLGDPAKVKPPKITGGSTITQQLAKNLLLSGERTLLRKGQELVLTLMLEALLDKDRILTIYLNSVEWGEGVFGVEAAAQRYFKKPAKALSNAEAARLAVMLPSPKFFEKRPQSPYLNRRTATIAARMAQVNLP